VERWAFMVARVLFPWLTPWGNTTAPTRGRPYAKRLRPTCRGHVSKALPASLHPPSPLRIIRTHFVRLMPTGVDLKKPRPGVDAALILTHSDAAKALQRL
jgi:hypothetical protein